MIKLFICDCDGTLTDGVYQMSNGGTDKLGRPGIISKNFYTRDFHGLWMLSNAGVEVAVITVASDGVIDNQCRRGAKYAKVITGAKDKKAIIYERYVGSSVMRLNLKVGWHEIAFIGDDIFDIELMNAVGIAACPADAHTKVKHLIHERDDGFVSSFPGGRGAVREFADYVLLTFSKII